MNEENTNQNPVEDNTTDYIGEIQRLRDNTVSKEDYERLREENKRLISSLANGESIGVEPEAKPDINALRKKVFENEHHSNLEYWENALNLRQALIDSGENDPFLPYGHKIVPTTEDVECANRVAEVVKECIEYANGDSQLFTNELNRRTVDVALPRKKH